MKALGLMTVALVAVLLAGCASMSKDECLTADWYAIGYEDGANGQPTTRIGSHREACAKHGVTPNLRDYQDGHDEGIIHFCTAQSGFTRARSGYQYTGICPPSLEPEFMDGYTAGRQIYTVNSELSSLRSEQRSNDNELRRLDQQLVEKEAALFAASTPEDQRRSLYDEIGLMKEQRGNLTQRNQQLIREVADAEARLRQLQDRYSYY
ncbi:MAG: DUF2799 domain-containing protein [Saccharospirillum sp.]|nr:DUF2799 domain-containing protein [Saccharospirillum sp.]